MDSLAGQPSLLRHRSFVLFWCARTSTSGAYQMQAVAVGWQLYDLTHDPLDLGLVGLMLGEFRAGALAAWIGAVPSALIGGVGVVLIALAWFRLFPALCGIERLTGETGERFPEEALTAE